MSGELEAAGAAATAGLVAGAIEGRETKEGGHGACANCGTQLEGAYCHACGQGAHPHRSLLHMVEEFVHGLLHFDTKAWRTLPMLVGRPGTLTRNYVYGKRARYISPLALFLFTVFFMFFVFAFMAPMNFNAAPAGDLDEASAGLQQARREIAAEFGTTQQAQGVDQTLAQVQEHVDAAKTEAPPAPGNDAESDSDEQFDWRQTMRDIAHADNAVVIDGMPQLNEQFRHKLENPDLLLYKLQQTAYKFSFLLVPISLPFIALLFLWKRGLTLYDHTVFALYSLCFASIVFVVAMLAAQSPWTNWIGDNLIAFGLPVHTFFHLKGAYALGWFSALWRTFFLLIFALIALVLFLLAIVMLGVTG